MQVIGYLTWHFSTTPFFLRAISQLNPQCFLSILSCVLYTLNNSRCRALAGKNIESFNQKMILNIKHGHIPIV